MPSSLFNTQWCAGVKDLVRRRSKRDTFNLSGRFNFETKRRTSQAPTYVKFDVIIGIEQL